ncbi:MAG: sulfatase [Verrucomicrobiota bacterium]
MPVPRLAVLLALAVSAVAAPGPARPNVLLLLADDLRPELAGYGSPALTPNLERLARRGVRFERAYCQQAVCNPSRSSFLTGLRPDTLGLWNNGTHFRELRPDVTTLPQHFRNHGYVTRNVGKVFHNWHTREKGDARSWSAPEFLHYATHGADAPQVEGPLPPNLASGGGRQYTDVPLTECRDVPDEAYYDGRVAAEAVRVLREIRDRPFFLAVGFWKPHAPFNAPKRYWDLDDRARLPPVDLRAPAGAPELALHDGREILGLPGPGRISPDAALVAEMRHGYFANISYLDAQLGKVLDALDASGVASRTVVVFAGDHGFHLGEHGLWGKTSNFELDARVPLLIALPGSGPRGVATRAFAELVDLFPTLNAACGLPAVPGLDGLSLLPVLRDPAAAVKPAAFSQHPRPAYYDREPAKVPRAMGYSVRTDAVRYTEWRDWASGSVIARELYDAFADGGETRNRAGDPALAAAEADAAARLRAQFPPRAR